MEMEVSIKIPGLVGLGVGLQFLPLGSVAEAEGSQVEG